MSMTPPRRFFFSGIEQRHQVPSDVPFSPQIKPLSPKWLPGLDVVFSTPFAFRLAVSRTISSLPKVSRFLFLRSLVFVDPSLLTPFDPPHLLRLPPKRGAFLLSLRFRDASPPIPYQKTGPFLVCSLIGRRYFRFCFPLFLL